MTEQLLLYIIEGSLIGLFTVFLCVLVEFLRGL